MGNTKKSTYYKNGCYFSLAYSIGSLGLAYGSMWSLNEFVDRISLLRGIFLTSLGFVHFVSLTRFFDTYVLETSAGKKFRKKYRLMVSDVMELTNRIVSALQAVYSFIVGLVVCRSTCSKSFVHASHAFMEAYGWFGTAYFMYDIWSMYKVHAQKFSDKLSLKHYARKSSKSSNAPSVGDIVSNDKSAFNKNETMESEKSLKGFFWYIITHPVMIIHHVFIGTFGLLVVTYIRGGGHCIYSYMFMMEFSTPFVSLRSILSTLGLKNTNLYIVNGLAMILAFFVVRVCVWPYVMWRYSVAIDATLLQAVASLPTGCIISILILFLPQLYWFYLMVKGALKVLGPTKGNTKALVTAQSKNNNISPPNGTITKTYCNGKADKTLLTK